MKTLLVLLLLCSCAANVVWRHKTKTQEQYYQDVTKCRVAVGQATANGDSRVEAGINTKKYSEIVFSDCMRGEGWYPSKY